MVSTPRTCAKVALVYFAGVSVAMMTRAVGTLAPFVHVGAIPFIDVAAKASPVESSPEAGIESADTSLALENPGSGKQIRRLRRCNTWRCRQRRRWNNRNCPAKKRKIMRRCGRSEAENVFHAEHETMRLNDDIIVNFNITGIPQNLISTPNPLSVSGHFGFNFSSDLILLRINEALGGFNTSSVTERLESASLDLGMHSVNATHLTIQFTNDADQEISSIDWTRPQSPAPLRGLTSDSFDCVTKIKIFGEKCLKPPPEDEQPTVTLSFEITSGNAAVSGSGQVIFELQDSNEDNPGYWFLHDLFDEDDSSVTSQHWFLNNSFYNRIQSVIIETVDNSLADHIDTNGLSAFVEKTEDDRYVTTGGRHLIVNLGWGGSPVSVLGQNFISSTDDS